MIYAQRGIAMASRLYVRMSINQSISQFILFNKQYNKTQ